MARTRFLWTILILACGLAVSPCRAQPSSTSLQTEAEKALKKAATFYRGKVASHGGYVYYYSVDLSEQWGEGQYSRDTIFVQPPGTPAVGMAYLKAYSATGDPSYLAAAREAAEALVAGQLASGGWTQVIHFGDPGRGRMGWYRKGRKRGSWNFSSLDDGQTQAALECLIRTDQALKFRHAGIHEATLFGLNALLKAQFPNGAFPQGWKGPSTPHPIIKARFPGYDWKTEGRIKNYWDYYTLNDNLAGDVARTLMAAHAVYRHAKYRAALEKLGAFLMLAQMPDPQPGWCQQYSDEMFPMWARKFEPPAITGWESQDVMETLISIARHTGNKKYLRPIPRALAYFKRSLLPDGQVARYYELKTNRPLYMDEKYRLTHNYASVAGHYGWKQPARFGEIEKAYRAAMRSTRPEQVPAGNTTEKQVRQIIGALDDKGRWISTYNGERLVGQPRFARGFQYISSAVFSRNVKVLSDYITACRP